MESFERTQIGFRSELAGTKDNNNGQGGDKCAEAIDQSSVMCRCNHNPPALPGLIEM